MRELPIEFNARLKTLINQMAQHESYGLHKLESESEDMLYKFLSGMLMNNKVVFISEMPTFTYNNKVYSVGHSKVDSIESMNSMLEKKFSENREVFCYYSISLSPTMYHPTTYASSHAIMLRGAFVPVSEDFELKDIIDRDQQIDKILN